MSWTSYQTAGSDSSRCMSLQRMHVVAEDGEAGLGQAAGDGPVVAADTGLGAIGGRLEGTGRGGRGAVRAAGERRGPRSAASGRRRDGRGGQRQGREVERRPRRDDRVDEGRVVREESGNGLVPASAPVSQAGQGRVLIEGGQDVGHGLDQEGGLIVRPGLGAVVEELELDRQPLAAEVGDAGVDAGGEGRQGLPRPGVAMQGLDRARRRPGQAEAAGEEVLADRGRADDLGDPAGRVERLEVHLPEAEGGRDVALGHEQVVVVGGEDVRHAAVVPDDADLLAQAGQAQLGGQDVGALAVAPEAGERVEEPPERREQAVARVEGPERRGGEEQGNDGPDDLHARPPALLYTIATSALAIC